jgi:NAD(P)-dependent dehydrogenase (short-subunit alcohol dehydrogenase family)
MSYLTYAFVGVELDHMDENSIATGFQECLDAAGTVDVVVNNGLQGIDTAQGQKLDIEATTFDQFAKQQSNNAGYFVLARCLRNHVVSRGANGSVIMIGSMYGQVASYPDAYAGLPYSSPVSYHSLKGGTIHLTRHLAAYWADDKVRVNCLSPGPFPGPSAPAELVKRLKTKLPMKRMGEPHELKGCLLLLASDAGSYITGQNYTVDGGWTCW